MKNTFSITKSFKYKLVIETSSLKTKFLIINFSGIANILRLNKNGIWKLSFSSHSRFWTL